MALTAYQVILDCDEIGHWMIAGHLDFAQVSHYIYNVQLVWIHKNKKNKDTTKKVITREAYQ